MKGTHLIVGEVSGLPRGLPFLSGSGGRRVEVGLFRVGEGEGAAVGRDAQYQLARIAAQLDVVADSPLLEGGNRHFRKPLFEYTSTFQNFFPGLSRKFSLALEFACNS